MAQDLPEHASVVVIGGGVMGCSTLYHLAKFGADAILLERNKLTSGTTWHSAAQVRALRSSQNLTRMIQYSVDLYSQLEQETGQSVGWIQKGSLSIATNDDRLRLIKRQEALAHAYGIAAQSISPGEAADRWPLMNSDDVIGAVWSPEDGRVSPSDVCAALVKGAKSHGAKLLEDTGVTGILTENGKIRGVETSRGVVRCDAVAICSGLWSRDVGAMAGAEVPLLACEHFYLLTKPIDGITGNVPTLSDHDNYLYIHYHHFYLDYHHNVTHGHDDQHIHLYHTRANWRIVLGGVNIFDEYIGEIGPPNANRLSVGLQYPRRTVANYEGGSWYLRGSYSW